ncbi:unnamed protein product [Lampetra fluviatilis]
MACMERLVLSRPNLRIGWLSYKAAEGFDERAFWVKIEAPTPPSFPTGTSEPRQRGFPHGTGGGFPLAVFAVPSRPFARSRRPHARAGLRSFDRARRETSRLGSDSVAVENQPGAAIPRPGARLTHSAAPPISLCPGSRRLSQNWRRLLRSAVHRSHWTGTGYPGRKGRVWGPQPPRRRSEQQQCKLCAQLPLTAGERRRLSADGGGGGTGVGCRPCRDGRAAGPRLANAQPRIRLHWVGATATPVAFPGLGRIRADLGPWPPRGRTLAALRRRNPVSVGREKTPYKRKRAVPATASQE